MDIEDLLCYNFEHHDALATLRQNPSDRKQQHNKAITKLGRHGPRIRAKPSIASCTSLSRYYEGKNPIQPDRIVWNVSKRLGSKRSTLTSALLMLRLFYWRARKKEIWEKHGLAPKGTRGLFWVPWFSAHISFSLRHNFRIVLSHNILRNDPQTTFLADYQGSPKTKFHYFRGRLWMTSGD